VDWDVAGRQEGEEPSGVHLQVGLGTHQLKLQEAIPQQMQSGRPPPNNPLYITQLNTKTGADQDGPTGTRTGDRGDSTNYKK